MTKKDRTVIGLIVLALAILLAVIIKNGGNQLPMPNKSGSLSAPLSPEELSAEPPTPISQDSTTTPPAAVPDKKPMAETPEPASIQPDTSNNRDGDAVADESTIEQSLTPIELALKFQAALNGVDAQSGAASTEDSAFQLVSLFAELPEDPKAEAALAQELVTAYQQSSNDNEKSALIDLLLIIPSDAGLRLGETLSRSANPEERQAGLELIANGGPAEFNRN